ncbi:MAG: flagellar biosynthetic protein FliP [Chlamydiales bacterium]|jgi:flagellar biosynthetic protein FliP|nr:flagellar biosynthetic protein FliP [Chlamydiales bacterium]
MKNRTIFLKYFAFFAAFLLIGIGLEWIAPQSLYAQVNPFSPSAPSILESTLDSPNPTQQRDYLNLHNQLRIVGLLTLITLIPFVLTMMTSFTRIMIIFSFLRQALGTQQVPSSQILVGLSLVLTGFVMSPVIEEIQKNALTPYMENQFVNDPEVRMGLKGEDTLLMERSWKPLRDFMLEHTREKDMMLFLNLGDIKLPPIDIMDASASDQTKNAYDLSAIPWYCLTPAFILSELRIAFMMGFLLFLPFLVIDMVISSVLMSMGMMMLPPVMISIPFKLLLFIIVDGWNLVIQQIIKGFFPLG